jgi:hypothetical protein
MKIKCKLGHAVTPVGGVEYAFENDGNGNHIAEVFDIAHQRCLLSVEHYEEFVEEAEPEADKPKTKAKSSSAKAKSSGAKPKTEPKPEPEPEPEPTAPSGPDVPLEDLTREQLEGIAAERQITVPADANKDDLIDAILAAEE